MAAILAVENRPLIAHLLERRQSSREFVRSVPHLADAWDEIAAEHFDLVIWNAAAKSASEIDFEASLKRLCELVGRAKVIVLAPLDFPLVARSRDKNIILLCATAAEDKILALVNRLLPCGGGQGRVCREPADAVLTDFEGLLAVSLPMRAVVQRALEAAAVDVPVLITGETGTGKDLLAAGIHRRSRRKNHPFVAINTGAMAPELVASELFGHEKGAFTGAQDTRPGIFEQADGGTVFLDEIAAMDAKTQISLLRVLEEKSLRRIGGAKNIATDVRIIAAANENLDKNIAERRFREDLFYRLNVFHIEVPPLRERPGAVTVLVDHFVAKFAPYYGKEIDRVAPETYRLLRQHPWPGNVRELKNVIQTAVLMADSHELTPDLIPPRIRDAAPGAARADAVSCSFPLGVTLEAAEKELIRMTLASVGGSKRQAAEILGISRRALYDKIARHKIS